jgi:hypothetical protein
MVKEYKKNPDGSLICITDTQDSIYSIGDYKYSYNPNKVFTDQWGTWVAFDGDPISDENLQYFNDFIDNAPNYFQDNLAYTNMTGNAAPAPQVAYTDGAGTYAYVAFTDNNSNQFTLNGGTRYTHPVYGTMITCDSFIGIDLGEEYRKAIKAFSLRSNTTKFFYRGFKLYGSDTTDYFGEDLLYEETAHPLLSAQQTVKFSIKNSSKHRFYTFKLLEIYRDATTSDNPIIGKIELWDRQSNTMKFPLELTNTNNYLKTFIKVA